MYRFSLALLLVCLVAFGTGAVLKYVSESEPRSPADPVIKRVGLLIAGTALFAFPLALCLYLIALVYS